MFDNIRNQCYIVPMNKYMLKLVDDPKLRKCSTESPRYTDAPLFLGVSAQPDPSLTDQGDRFFFWEFEVESAQVFDSVEAGLKTALLVHCFSPFAPSETVDIVGEGGRRISNREFVAAFEAFQLDQKSRKEQRAAVAAEGQASHKAQRQARRSEQEAALQARKIKQDGRPSIVDLAAKAGEIPSIVLAEAASAANPVQEAAAIREIA